MKPGALVGLAVTAHHDQDFCTATFDHVAVSRADDPQSPEPNERNNPVPASESATHLKLKRLALIWAQANRYPIVGAEVSLPNLRFRLDVGAYRPASRRETRAAPLGKGRRLASVAAVGVTAIFEAKASRADFIRDGRSAARLLGRMKALNERRATLERLLQIHYPSLRNGDALWPEYQTFNLEGADHAPYRKVIQELRTLTGQLHGQTKLEQLLKWEAANLHYLVAEPGIIEPPEVPLGWGLLVRDGERLDLRVCPEWREVREKRRVSSASASGWATAGTRAANREAGIDFPAIEAERRGLLPGQLPSPEAGLSAARGINTSQPWN